MPLLSCCCRRRRHRPTRRRRAQTRPPAKQSGGPSPVCPPLGDGGGGSVHGRLSPPAVRAAALAAAHRVSGVRRLSHQCTTRHGRRLAPPAASGCRPQHGGRWSRSLTLPLPLVIRSMATSAGGGNDVGGRGGSGPSGRARPDSRARQRQPSRARGQGETGPKRSEAVGPGGAGPGRSGTRRRGRAGVDQGAGLGSGRAGPGRSAGAGRRPGGAAGPGRAGPEWRSWAVARGEAGPGRAGVERGGRALMWGRGRVMRGRPGGAAGRGCLSSTPSLPNAELRVGAGGRGSPPVRSGHRCQSRARVTTDSPVTQTRVHSPSRLPGKWAGNFQCRPVRTELRRSL
jgi:hypothetical protein